MATKIIKFTNSSLSKVGSSTSFNEFRDPRYPLRLRLHASRETGSWYLFKNRKYEKIGNFPSVTLKDILVNLGSNLLSEKVIPESEFTTIGQVLNWYLNRGETNRQITNKRFSTIKWAITKHLLPHVGDVKLDTRNLAAELDRCFFQPVQYKCSIATVKNLWVVLKQSINRADQLMLISPSPISAMEFRQFISAGKLASRPSLRFYQVKKIFEMGRVVSVPARALVAIMLLHGTRIGETRSSAWRDICFETKIWIIPGAITKTKTELKLPLTDLSISIFREYKNWQLSKGYAGVFMFPGSAAGRKSIGEKKADLLINEISEGDWTSHQIRKFARTAWIDLHIDYLIGELLLNHKLGKVPATYIKTDAEMGKRNALEKYHAWLSENFPGLNSIINCATDARPLENENVNAASECAALTTVK